MFRMEQFQPNMLQISFTIYEKTLRGEELDALWEGVESVAFKNKLTNIEWTVKWAIS